MAAVDLIDDHLQGLFLLCREWAGDGVELQFLDERCLPLSFPTIFGCVVGRRERFFSRNPIFQRE